MLHLPTWLRQHTETQPQFLWGNDHIFTLAGCHFTLAPDLRCSRGSLSFTILEATIYLLPQPSSCTGNGTCKTAYNHSDSGWLCSHQASQRDSLKRIWGPPSLPLITVCAGITDVQTLLSVEYQNTGLTHVRLALYCWSVSPVCLQVEIVLVSDWPQHTYLLSPI